MPMPPTPRSRKLLDPRTRRKLIAELRVGPTRSKALERLHISESTFYRELERSAELRALVNGHGGQKGNGDRNGNGTAPRSKANGGNRKGREHRREGGDLPDPGAAQDLPAQARATAEASSALAEDVPSEPLAEPAPEVAAPVQPLTAKASKAAKRPRTSKRADRARQKGEVPADPPPEAHPGRKRRARVDPEQASSVATAVPDASASPVAAPRAAAEPIASEAVATAPADLTPAAALAPKKPAARRKTPPRPRSATSRAPAEAPVAPAKVFRSRGPAPTAEVHTMTGARATAATVMAAPVTAARTAPTPARRRQGTGSQQAYWLPPVLVLASEIVVGLVVGASPIILLLVTGSMVAVLYVVRRWGSQPTPPSRRSQPPKVAQAETSWPPPASTTSRAGPIAVPIPGQEPPPVPIDNRPSGSVSPAGNAGSNPARGTAANPPGQPSAPQGEAGHNDLRWLWNSIGRDPRPPRPPRRDGR